MGGTAVSADDRCRYLQKNVYMLWHDDERVDANHAIVCSNAGKEFLAYHLPDRRQGNVRTGGCAIGLFQRAFHLSQWLTHPFCHMQGDVVDAWQRVVVSLHTALHAVVVRTFLLHVISRPAS